MYCPLCGFANHYSDHACKSCGESLVKDYQVSHPEPKVEIPEAEPVLPRQIRFHDDAKVNGFANIVFRSLYHFLFFGLFFAGAVLLNFEELAHKGEDEWAELLATLGAMCLGLSCIEFCANWLKERRRSDDREV